MAAGPLPIRRALLVIGALITAEEIKLREVQLLIAKERATAPLDALIVRGGANGLDAVLEVVEEGA